MPLSKQQRKELKARAHHLKPVIRIGQKGITENLVQETIQTLHAHELIKVHIADDERESRQQKAAHLAELTGAELVHQIGKTCIIYRQRETED